MIMTMRALAIVEGLEDAKDETEEVAAWQHLIDSGLAWSLPGHIGRTARDLLESGVCRFPGATHAVRLTRQ